MNWHHKIKLTHIMENCNTESIVEMRKTMRQIKEIVQSNDFMSNFGRFTNIPRSITDAEQFKALTDLQLNKLYNYCDDNAIWVE